jgi:pilus assembly protein Flp/PilA
MGVQLYVWLATVKSRLQNQKGQGMVEYGLILAVISLAAIVALETMGNNVGNMFTNAAAKMNH